MIEQAAYVRRHQVARIAREHVLAMFEELHGNVRHLTIPGIPCDANLVDYAIGEGGFLLLKFWHPSFPVVASGEPNPVADVVPVLESQDERC